MEVDQEPVTSDGRRDLLGSGRGTKVPLAAELVIPILLKSELTELEERREECLL